MAGIGFELRRLINKDTYLGSLQAYTVAGLIGSGPWVLSILGVLAVGILGSGLGAGTEAVRQFHTSVTYLMASSLLLSGFLQLLFTRFIADRHFENRPEMIFGNLLGALTLTTLLSGALGTLVVGLLFDASLLYQMLMVASFVTLTNLWIIVVFLTGMKHYRTLIVAFFLGYGVMVGAALLLRRFGLEGLLGGFFLGHAVLVFVLLGLVIRAYPGERLVAFDFLSRRHSFYSLAIIGFLFNFGLWADKLVFWMHPATSEPIIGPLRASPIYDLPVFLAYFSLIPGMAIFLMRIETDFAEEYDHFYNAVRDGGTLQEIEGFRDKMVGAVRRGIYDLFKVQGLSAALLFIFAPLIFRTLGVSPVYRHLFAVELVGVAGLVLFLSILNVFFYLDQKAVALFLSLLFAVSNVGLSIASLHAGPSFYGYGFSVSVMLTSVAGLLMLSRIFERLEYDTFMLQA